MGGPWQSSCFIFVIIIQHDDAVSGGHGGSNPPEGGSVGDFVIPAGRGWGLRQSPSSIAPSLHLTHFPVFLGFKTPSHAQQCPHCLSSATISTMFSGPFTMGAPNHLKTLSPTPSSTPHVDIRSFSCISPLFLIVGKLILPLNPWTTSHIALQISLTSPRTDTTPPLAPPQVFSPFTLTHIRSTPSLQPEGSPQL